METNGSLWVWSHLSFLWKPACSCTYFYNSLCSRSKADFTSVLAFSSHLLIEWFRLYSHKQHVDWNEFIIGTMQQARWSRNNGSVLPLFVLKFFIHCKATHPVWHYINTVYHNICKCTMLLTIEYYCVAYNDMNAWFNVRILLFLVCVIYKLMMYS